MTRLKSKILYFYLYYIIIFDLLSIKIEFNIVYIVLIPIIFLLVYEHVNIYKKINTLSKYYILYIIYLFFNAFFISVDFETSLQYSVIYVLWLLVYIAYQINSKYVAKELLKVFLKIHKFLFYFLIFSIILSISFGKSRLYSFVHLFDLGGYNPNGMAIIVLFFLLLSMILRHEKLLIKRQYLSSLIIFILSFSYANSRGAILSVIIVLIISTFTKNKYIKHIRIFMLLMFLIFISIFFVIYALDIKIDNYQYHKIIDTLNSLFGDTKYDSTAGRGNMYAFGMIVLENSKLFIFGTGLEAYRSIFDQFSGSFSEYFEKMNVTLHSTYLQHLVGLGSLGISLYLLLLRQIYKESSYLMNKQIKQIFIFILFVLLLNSITSSSMINRLLMVYIPILLLYFNTYKKGKI